MLVSLLCVCKHACIRVSPSDVCIVSFSLLSPCLFTSFSTGICAAAVVAAFDVMSFSAGSAASAATSCSAATVVAVAAAVYPGITLFIQTKRCSA